MRTPPAICFVCLGNICRSPTAEAIARALAERQHLTVHIESAGTAAYHVGERPDPRTRSVGEARGYRFESVGQHFQASDFDRFDWVIAMDGKNLSSLRTLARGPEDQAKLRLMRDFDPASPRGAEVPDPYYGERRDFELVVDLCERACAGLFDALRAETARSAHPDKGRGV